VSSAADGFAMKNSFVVKFGVSLWLASMGITGFWIYPLRFIAEWIIGSAVDQGILQIDLSIASIKVAMQDEQYKTLAKEAYSNAMAKVYTEEEKVKIRLQYLNVLRDFARVGNIVMPVQPNS
jgi:hypothetical protein